MRMLCVLIATLFILPAAYGQDDPAPLVEKSLRSLKTAFSQGDAETLKRLMTKDHELTLSYARFTSTADLLKALGEFKIVDYQIEGLQVKVLAPDAALATFRATTNGTYKGRIVPSPARVVEVWIKRDGQWLQASYQETPIDTK
jgi:uncharacterized protein (TIGR02246 family)